MKKLTAILLAILMTLGCCPVLSEAAASEAAAQTHTIVSANVPLYFYAAEPFEAALPIYYADGVDDLPYMNLPDFVGLVNRLNDYYGVDTTYSGAAGENPEEYDIVYSLNKAVTSFDFKEGSVYFGNYDAFFARPGRSMLDVLYASGINARSGLPELFKRVTDPLMDRAGESVTIPLADYAIPLIAQDGKYLVPLHTLFSLLWCIPMSQCVYFNGQAVFLGGSDMFVEAATNPLTGEPSTRLSALGQLYYGAEKRLRSEDFAFFGLGELCMELDYFYGLKDAHHVKDFFSLLLNTEYFTRLIDPDTAVADAALEDFINYYLDDLHSGYLGNSWMTGYETQLETADTGISSFKDSGIGKRYNAARESAMPDGYKFYQEVGNTAYVTFDRFLADGSMDYYSLNLDDPDCVRDTISLVLYANHQITRPNSPIENVVLDLSLNTGGDADAAVFVIGWYLGIATITNVNTFSGAQGTAMYLVDTDLDRLFTREDSLDTRYNLYCLISPYSFSCANLVPWCFKTSGFVTLLGDTTGGGSCVVLPRSTAWGTSFKISGNSRLSFVKNGSFYDVDQGVEPDIALTRLSSFYNREALTDLINKLP